jgi:hypothetical protein
MRHLAPALAVSLLLTTGWWDNLIRTTAEALGLQSLIEADQTTTATPPPSENPSLDSGCSWDPLGGLVCNNG